MVAFDDPRGGSKPENSSYHQLRNRGQVTTILDAEYIYEIYERDALL
jgi:hypothetical protein